MLTLLLKQPTFLKMKLGSFSIKSLVNHEGLYEALKQLEFIDDEKIMTLADHLKPEVFERGFKMGFELGLLGVGKGKKEREAAVEKAWEEKILKTAKDLYLNEIDVVDYAKKLKLSKKAIKKVLMKLRSS